MKHVIAFAFLLAASVPALAQWEYNNSTDKMSGDEQRMASATSKNKLNLGFPYQDSNNRARISIMRAGKKATRVLFGITKGQLNLSSDTSLMRVRFDDEKPEYWRCAPTDGHDSCFFVDTTKMIAKLKKAKKAMFDVLLYRMTGDIMEFEVAGLKWE